MARPRKPDDPYLRHEIPCDRCGGGYNLVVRWGPADEICGYCYQQAKRTRGTCQCGHVGVLPGRVNGQPACRSCSGVRINIDCVGCGAEDELYAHGLCWGCTLGNQIDSVLTNPATGVVADSLEPLAVALKSMKRANSGLTWLRQPHVTAFLKDLATHPTVTHEGFDELPPSRTRDYVRGLLVEHGVLPRRDEIKVLYERWALAALDRLTDEQNRAIIDRYIRWHHMRRMNEMDAVPRGTFLRSKQTVTVAIDFLNWLHKRDIPLSDLQQADVDAWVLGGKTTRLIADRFLGWAMKNRLAPRGMTIPRHRRGTSKRLSTAEQNQALHEVTRGSRLTTRDRAAAILILVFGQRVEDVVALTWDDIVVKKKQVTVKLGTFPIILNDPLDGPFRELVAHPEHDQTAAHPNSPWVFRGLSPGQHIQAISMALRLKERLFGARAARLGTLQELSKTAPVPIIADALGYSPMTIERCAKASGAEYAEYVAAVVDASRYRALVNRYRAHHPTATRADPHDSDKQK